MNKLFTDLRQRAYVAALFCLTAANASYAQSLEELMAQLNTIKADSIIIVRDSVLKDLVVTGSRKRTPLSQTGKEITIITAKEIRESSAKSINDLLVSLAGVDVQQRGAHGTQADISMRGGLFDQTAVLIDGINISNPQTGHYSMDIPLNVYDIDHIEVLHGPATAIYGASAMSGAINIVTKKAPDELLTAVAEAGKHKFLHGGMGLTLHDGITSHRISIDYKQTDGYSSNSNGDPNSDYVIATAFWQSHINWGKSWLDVQAGFNDKKIGASTFYSSKYDNQYEKTLALYGSVKANVRLADNWHLQPAIYANRHLDEFRLKRDLPIDALGRKAVPNYHSSDAFGGNINLMHDWSLGTTTAAIDLRGEGVQSNTLGDPRTTYKGKYSKDYYRANFSYTLEHSLNYEDLTLTAAALVNHLPDAKSDKWNIYPTASLAYRPIDGLKVYASYSQAGRLPTFTELFYNTATHTADRSLKSESSYSFDLGVEYKGEGWSVSAAVFDMETKNLIDWMYSSGDDKWHSVNHAKAHKQGVDLGASLELDNFISLLSDNTTLRVDYAYLTQKGKDFSTLGVSGYVLNYLKQKFTARMHLPLYKDKIETTWNFRWQERAGSYLEAGQAKKFKPFSTLDARIQYNVSPELGIHIDVNNLYNTNYFDIGSYLPQAGLWWIAGVSINFK